jgi:hypothetical protein
LLLRANQPSRYENSYFGLIEREWIKGFKNKILRRRYVSKREENRESFLECKGQRKVADVLN